MSNKSIVFLIALYIEVDFHYVSNPPLLKSFRQPRAAPIGIIVVAAEATFPE